MPAKTTIPHSQRNPETTPFSSAEEVWFWFMNAMEAAQDGARFAAGMGLWNRPCEPLDIWRVMQKMHRNRQLDMNHFRVLKHYGARNMTPNPAHPKEIRSWHLWNEAMEKLDQVFRLKKILAEDAVPFECARLSVIASSRDGKTIH